MKNRSSNLRLWNWVTCSALTLAGTANFTGCASRSGVSPIGNASELYARGARALDSGDTAAAIESLQAAAKAEPKMIMAHLRLGDAYKEANAFPKAAEQYEIVTQLDAYDPASWYKLGAARHLSGKLSGAADAYEHALRLDPQEWHSRTNLGMVKLAQGKKDDALTDTRKATEIAGNEPQVWLNYGIALDATGDYPRGEAAYRKSLELKPRQGIVLLNLGNNLIAQKQTADAIGVLEQAVAADPTPEAHRRLGDALKAEHRDADAEMHYQAAKNPGAAMTQPATMPAK